MKRIASAALAAFCIAAPAQAALVGVQSGASGGIYSIDPTTGAATLLTTLADEVSFTGASYLDEVLYATDVLVGSDFGTGTLDAGTGAYVEVSDQDGSANWHALGSDETAGLLYTVDQVGDVLKSLTPGGVTTAIGTGVGAQIRGLAYNDADDILYGLGWDNSVVSLYNIDTTTGVGSLIGLTGMTDFYLGLAYDEDSGILYATDATALYALNTATGAATSIGATGFSNIDGLAWIADETEVPIPAAAPLLLVGLGGLAALGRRRG